MKYIQWLLISLFFMPIQVLAFELFPMVQMVEDLGKRNTTFFKVSNASLAPLPIEVVATKRNVVLNNDETLSETGDFIIFPPQAMIAPGKSQTIKVQYIGDPKEITESYRIIVSQLPLKDASGNDSVQMLFRIGALLFVAPQKTHEQYSARIDKNEANTPMLIIENTGSRVIELDKETFSVDWNGDSHSWGWDVLEPVLPMQYLAPNQRVEVNVETLL